MIKTFKESIIDIPRRRYASGIFDDADSNNPKLKQKVIDMILDQIDKFQEKYPVKKYSLIGSILTKRYRDDADLDINVLFDVPEEDRETARLELAKGLKDINGKNVPGTTHPVNYYVITDPELKAKNDAMADGVFDIDENEFVRRPKEDTFDSEKYEAEFQKKVQEIDVVKGELTRDLVDYKELKSLSTDDVLNLQDRINGKLEEIEDSIQLLVDIGDDVVKQRQDAFGSDMTPDQIRAFGKKHKLPKNIIYKHLEKYHYLKMYKKLKDILEDGIVTDDEIDSLQTEAKGKSIAFTFGRFNPPTIGHEKLINKVKSMPTNDYRIYLSRSEDSKKNPLSAREKLSVMKKMFPSHASKIEINTSNMILDIATKLSKKGFTSITMVVGSDRVREFEGILKKYNKVKSRHGLYDFEDIKVVSAGERDPDADGASGMSASKMRAAAQKGDLNTFKRGLPSAFRDVDGLMRQVRRGMNLAASYGGMASAGIGTFKPIASMEQFEQNQVRDLYVREMIFNIDDKVKYIKEDIEGKVKRRGTNYIVIEDNNNNLHKAWIWDCLPISANREVEVREYDTNIDYGFTAVDSIPPKSLKKFKEMYYNEELNMIKPEDKGEETKEAYDIGHDYADYVAKITPGEPNYDPKFEGGSYKPSDPKKNLKRVINNFSKFRVDKESENVKEKDVKEWAMSDATIDKYRERYKELWRQKLDEVVKRMIDKI